MPASVLSRAVEQLRYMSSARQRLCARHSALVLALMLCGLACGGCSYKIGSLMGGKEDDKPEQVAAVTAKPAAGRAEVPVDADLVYARAAVSDALNRDSGEAGAPWENPRTGARGTITPYAAAYTQDGFVCRDFLASHVRDGAESWFKGEACRVHRGGWEVRKLTPWQRS